MYLTFILQRQYFQPQTTIENWKRWKNITFLKKRAQNKVSFIKFCGNTQTEDQSWWRERGRRESKRSGDKKNSGYIYPDFSPRLVCALCAQSFLSDRGDWRFSLKLLFVQEILKEFPSVISRETLSLSGVLLPGAIILAFSFVSGRWC